MQRQRARRGLLHKAIDAEDCARGARDWWRSRGELREKAEEERREIGAVSADAQWAPDIRGSNSATKRQSAQQGPLASILALFRDRSVWRACAYTVQYSIRVDVSIDVTEQIIPGVVDKSRVRKWHTGVTAGIGSTRPGALRVHPRAARVAVPVAGARGLRNRRDRVAA